VVDCVARMRGAPVGAFSRSSHTAAKTYPATRRTHRWARQLPDLVFRGCAAMVVYSRFPPPPDAYAASARRQYRGSWPTAIVLVAHVPTTTPPERELHAGKGTSRALTTGAPVMSAYERTYVRALTPLAGTRVAAGPAGREASRQEVAGRVRQGARIFLQRVGEAADVGLKKSAVLSPLPPGRRAARKKQSTFSDCQIG
jgi:hypothetical protein